MAYDVFISYASEDKIVADAVCAMLESHAVRCWIAPRDVLPGVAYGEAIIDAIRGCRIMILVFSSKSNTSPHIPKEIERAVSAGVAVIPFRIEDVKPGKSLDYFIGSVHWLDALTRPLEQHLERLVQNVQTLLSRDAPVIERKNSSTTAVLASSVASSPARLPWLYAALGIMAVLVIVFAVLLFARKPSKTAQIAPAPVSSTPPAASQPPTAVASQPSGISSTGSSDAALTPKPTAPAATQRAPRKEPKTGVHDAARVPVQPETPASLPATASTSAAETLFDQGLFLYRGKQFSQAAELYQKACDGGERKGCHDLGLMYYKGEGVVKDLNRAARLFKRACDAGGSGGCQDLGLMYSRGEGVAKDLIRAADLYKRACDAGAAPGCTDLGLMYNKGEGVAKDLNRAADLFKRACGAGGSGGCLNLGSMYLRGQGVPKDLDRAADLFKKACDLGLDRGCENLARLKK
ncbi:MAG TPA: TIR domain-containing protein [Terriglobales bacterium]|nr:TIR domain-containing protein [Terriglobales bacterium]